MASSSSSSNIEQDLAFLIVQFLDEHNLTETARTLEKEGELIFNMKYVEEAVTDGKWEELEAYILHFTNINENQHSTQMIYEIRRQKYIEALGKTDTETPRGSIFYHLKQMIEMNPVLNDKLHYPSIEDSRLKLMMNQSINWQHALCRYPDANHTVSTLYVDHTCGDELVLSLNDGDCRGLGYLPPHRTDEREESIIPEIRERAQLYSLRLSDPILLSNIESLSYNNSGNAIFALSCAGVLKFWELKAEETFVAREETSRIICKRSSFLANDVGTGEHELVVPCFALSKNDSYVASASGGKVSLFGLRESEFKNMTAFMPPPPAATAVLFYPEDNNLVIFGMEDGSIRIYDVRTDQVKAQIQAHDQKRVSGLAYSSALNTLVSSAYNAEICSWNNFALMKQSSTFLRIYGCAVSPGRTCVKFHRDLMHMLVVHESCIATLEGPDLKPCTQWNPREIICDATYSCDGHTIYVSFAKGHIVLLDPESFALRCIINPSAYIPLNPRSLVHACAIAANPRKPNQFALGLSDGCILIVAPREGDCLARPQLENAVV